MSSPGEYLLDNEAEKWPESGTMITFATPEDAQKMAKVLNDVYGELEGMWAHIRNLEKKLLAPSEMIEVHAQLSTRRPNPLIENDYY